MTFKLGLVGSSLVTLALHISNESVRYIDPNYVNQMQSFVPISSICRPIWITIRHLPFHQMNE